MENIIYKPYIKNVMHHIDRIYDTTNVIRYIVNKGIDTTDPIMNEEINIIHYDINKGLKEYCNYRQQENDGYTNNDNYQKMIGISNQFITSIKQIKNCVLFEEYQYIKLWEDIANNILRDYNDFDEYLDKVLKEVIEARIEKREPNILPIF